MQIVTCLHPDSPIKTAILRDDGSIVCQTNINQTDGEFAVVDPPLKNVLQIAVNPTGLWGLNTAGCLHLFCPAKDQTSSGQADTKTSYWRKIRAVQNIQSVHADSLVNESNFR